MYIDIVIKPELASAVRGLTSEVEAKALYTSDRSVIQSKLSADLAKVRCAACGWVCGCVCGCVGACVRACVCVGGWGRLKSKAELATGARQAHALLRSSAAVSMQPNYLRACSPAISRCDRRRQCANVVPFPAAHPSRPPCPSTPSPHPPHLIPSPSPPPSPPTLQVLLPRGIIVEDVLLKAVKLPTQLTHSIELKAQAEQESVQ